MSPKSKHLHDEMAGRYATRVYQVRNPQEAFMALLPPEREAALRALDDHRRAHRVSALSWTVLAFMWAYVVSRAGDTLPLILIVAPFLVSAMLTLRQAVKWARHYRLTKTLDHLV